MIGQLVWQSDVQHRQDTSKYKSLIWVRNEKQGKTWAPHPLNSNTEKGKPHLILSYMTTKTKKQTSKFHQPERERSCLGRPRFRRNSNKLSIECHAMLGRRPSHSKHPPSLRGWCLMLMITLSYPHCQEEWIPIRFGLITSINQPSPFFKPALNRACL